MDNPLPDRPSSQLTSKPAALACLECRRKHLKCDGLTPTCGRCLRTQVQCLYTPSRRGYKPAPRGQPSSSASPPIQAPSVSFPTPAPTGPATPQLPASPFISSPPIFPDISPDQLDPTALGTLSNSLFDPTSQEVAGLFPVPQNFGSDINGDEYLIDFYYAFFHESHPILPPIHLLPRLGPLPACLEAVIKFIGAHFAAGVPIDLYRNVAVTQISQTGTQDSWAKVQALVLLSIVLHARNERAEGVEALSTAVDLALDIGMNQQTFAVNMAGDDHIKVESLRRTWWELYMVDIMFSGFDQMPCKLPNTPITDVPLPCDELSYTGGVYILQPPPPLDFYDRIFSDTTDPEYSSYCYAIEASRILKRVLNLGYSLDGQSIDQIEAIDASIASWFHHLPASKSQVLTVEGNVDQMMFRAFMVIYCASIYLHLPRSTLLSTPVASSSIPCAGRGLCTPAPSTSLTHAMKSIRAANGLANLAALGSVGVKHTPFFVCGLVLAAVVQLCACSIRASRSLEPRRDRIALIIGELKSLNATWAISRLVMRQIKLVAREVLEIGVRPPTQSAIEDPGPEISSIVSSELWLGDIPDD
ncbi:hypothetical protein FQN57_004525 [Myotisia sp. PD_48]|nr:hypothetical protein FQN57_004525 [Myotisia sp. PD_48]